VLLILPAGKLSFRNSQPSNLLLVRADLINVPETSLNFRDIGVDMLCSDKTGTLTANKLSLNDPYVAPDVDPDWFMTESPCTNF